MHRSVPSSSMTLHCIQCLLGGFKRSAPDFMFRALGSFRPRFLLKNRSIVKGDGGGGVFTDRGTASRERIHSDNDIYTGNVNFEFLFQPIVLPARSKYPGQGWNEQRINYMKFHVTRGTQRIASGGGSHLCALKRFYVSGRV